MNPITICKEHLDLWKEVETTDPDRTKPVTFGRKFTAIDAHYQVKTATKIFGPVGLGWGYETTNGITVVDTTLAFAWCDLTLWYLTNITKEELKKRGTFGPIRGCAELVFLDKNGARKTDHDATKKAVTDALTKALSHLGFNADVFEGRFDDNKYVEDLREEKRRDQQDAQKKHLENRERFIKEVEACKTREEIKAALNKNQHWILSLDSRTARSILGWTNKQKDKLGQSEDFSLTDIENNGHQ